MAEKLLTDVAPAVENDLLSNKIRLPLVALRLTKKEHSFMKESGIVVLRSRELKVINFKLSESKTNQGKLCIVIPKAVGKAVVRNYLRRKIRGIYYEKKFYQSPLATTIIVHKLAQAASYLDLEKLISRAFLNAKKHPKINTEKLDASLNHAL